MSTYVIGDIHGCSRTLQKLLAKLDFDAEQDRLWLVGDLVNRGPDSLGVLRWARRLSDQLGERMVVVLGNHDLHLLALHAGLSDRRVVDDLKDILKAEDAEELITWLERRPLLHREGDHVLVHAGLLPQWTVDEAARWAARIAELLPTKEGKARLLRRPEPPDLDDETRELRRALGALTRLRTCSAAGELCSFSGPPEEAPAGCLPWFRIDARRSRDATILSGHWAALGLHVEPGVFALDSGCAWGGPLTALRLEDGTIVQQKRRD